MDNKQEGLIDSITKNKLMTAGFIAVLLIFLFDAYFVRPVRKTKELDSSVIKKTSSDFEVVSCSQNVANTAKKSAIDVPATISKSLYPSLPPRIENRFVPDTYYPYENGKNIISEIHKPEVIVKKIVKPNISYHGFFTVGNEKIAILRISEEILLTKVGTNIRKTSFKLTSMSPEKVVFTDLSDKLPDFEVLLSNETE